MKYIWIIVANIRHETCNEFLAAWPTKPTLMQLQKMLPTLYWDEVKQLKFRGNTTNKYGEDLALVRYKFGERY